MLFWQQQSRACGMHDLRGCSGLSARCPRGQGSVLTHNYNSSAHL